jgi:hypothetical protein
MNIFKILCECKETLKQEITLTKEEFMNDENLIQMLNNYLIRNYIKGSYFQYKIKNNICYVMLINITTTFLIELNKFVEILEEIAIKPFILLDNDIGISVHFIFKQNKII